MSELPHGIPRAEPPKPRPSAAGLVLRRAAAGGWEVLFVLRSRGSRFMPGHLAFPGGVMDPQDRPDDDGAFERCVAREVEEETGLGIAAADWIDAGLRTTPPFYPVRFDNRFFVVEAPPRWQPPETSPSPDEVESLAFREPREVLQAWNRGEALLPPPSLPLLRALAAIDAGTVGAVAQALRPVNAQEQRAPRIEFQPDVWVLPVATATLPPATHTNVWMPGGRRFVVIDPGADDPAECDRLLEVIARRRELGHAPVAVLLTHGHRDHTGGVGQVAAALRLPVRAHGEVLAALRPMPGIERAEIVDGERIDLDGLTLVAMLTPGHARGHLAFNLPERGTLIAGDLVSGISTIVIDPETGDMGAYLESLARVDALGCRTLLPAHGPPLPGRALAHLIAHRTEREARIAAALSDTPLGLPEIAREAYAQTPGVPPQLTEMQALAHLLWLERQGRARRADPQGRSWRLVETEIAANG